MSIWIGPLEITMRHYLYILQVLLAEGMFTYTLKRKPRFLLRLLLSLTVYLAVSVVVPALIYPYLKHNLFIVFVMSFPVLFVCFSCHISEIFFCYISAITVQNLSYNVGILFCMLFGVSPVISSGIASQIIQFAAYVSVHTVCFFLCAAKVRNKERFGGRTLFVVAVGAVVFLVIFILEGYLDILGQPYFAVARIMFFASDIMALLLLFFMSEKDRVDYEKKLLQSLIAKEHQQYRISKETMEVINMKSHDMRHLLGLLEKGGVVSDETIGEIKKATGTFGAMVNSGNPVLDVILTEKSLLCEKNGIVITYMVDDVGLDELLPEEIAAVFGNLLDNAIQYLINVESVELRVITLTIKRKLGMVFIHVENYCPDSLFYDDSLPVTTNYDKTIHGYGLKSVRFIVSKHNGVMQVGNKDDKFCVDITFPSNK